MHNLLKKSHGKYEVDILKGSRHGKRGLKIPQNKLFAKHPRQKSNLRIIICIFPELSEKVWDGENLQYLIPERFTVEKLT